MNKYFSIYLYGSIILLVGVFLLFSMNFTFMEIKWVMGISLTFGSLFAFIAAFYSQNKQVQFTYHEIHAMTMMIYGISVLLYCNQPENLIFITTFLFFFYTFSEIIFCNWLFNLKQEVVFKILIVRVLLALLIGIGTVFAINNEVLGEEIFGILFILVGINTILYVPIMKARQSLETSQAIIV